MIRMHVKVALSSLRSNKMRTFLTLLGIIIGVMSVTTIIGLGEGVKRQVSQQISRSGKDVITIAAGKQAELKANLQQGLGLNQVTSAAHLSEQDLRSVKDLKSVAEASGVMYLNGTIKRQNKAISAQILGVSQNYVGVSGLKLANGQNFGSNIENSQTTILGSKLAEKLFGSQNPVGSSVFIRGTNFIVIGVLKPSTGLEFGQSMNSTILIPLDFASRFNNDSIQLQRIIVSSKDPRNERQTITEIEAALRANRSGEQDFSVITREELVAQTNSVFRLLTGFTAAVASISLLVGGIGVMNIMLVTVTERTKEIGIRKAVGATKMQILMQFLTEALAITIAGGLIGILASLLLGYIIGTQTALRPAFNPIVILLAGGVSVLVGVMFGTWPAIRAARKNPTSSLKHE